MKKTIPLVTSQAMEILKEYAWPGNVRELSHIIERILILEDTDVIRASDLPSFITQRQGEFQMFSEEPMSLEELEKKYAGNPDIRFLKVDTQLHHSFAMENQIYAIPCVLIFFNGEPAKYEVDDQRSGEKKILNRLIGLRPIEHYENVISFFFSDK